MDNFFVSSLDSDIIINKKYVKSVKLDLELFCAIHFRMDDGGVELWEYNSEEDQIADWNNIKKTILLIN